MVYSLSGFIDCLSMIKPQKAQNSQKGKIKYSDISKL